MNKLRSLPKLFVLTGAGCSGKTTQIELARRAGYPVLEEQAELVIRENRLLPWRKEDANAFEDEVYVRQWQAEAAIISSLLIGEQKIVLLDRGLFDIEAYSKYLGVSNEHLFKSLDGHRYSAVLYCEPLLNYDKTSVRQFEQDQAHKIAEICEECYKSHGVPIYRIPVMSPIQRLDYMLGVCHRHLMAA